MHTQHRIARAWQVAQDRLLWRDKSCPAWTQLIMSWKAFLSLLVLLLLARVDQAFCTMILFNQQQLVESKILGVHLRCEAYWLKV